MMKMDFRECRVICFRLDRDGPWLQALVEDWVPPAYAFQQLARIVRGPIVEIDDPQSCVPTVASTAKH